MAPCNFCGFDLPSGTEAIECHEADTRNCFYVSNRRVCACVPWKESRTSKIVSVLNQLDVGRQCDTVIRTQCGLIDCRLAPNIGLEELLAPSY